tara:strand:+ start:70 stop:276 length:207 start_codon:yes stop_codon:yes gene_type:complete
MSIIKLEFPLIKFAGLNLTLVLPVEFKRWVCPMEVLLAEPVKGSLPIHLLNKDCPDRKDILINMMINL